MSIAARYNDGSIQAFCADTESIFRPFQVKETLLDEAKNESFVLINFAEISGVKRFTLLLW